MRVFLFLLSVLSFLVGCLVFFSAQSAIHEIEGGVLLLIAATLFSGAAVVESLKPLKKSEAILGLLALKLEDQKKTLDKIADSLAKTEAQPPPQPGEEKYYLAIDGKADGPYTLTDIRALAKRGSVDSSMKVAKVGDKVWTPVNSVL